MQIKKYLATGLSTVMAGATLAGGAFAQTSLSEYPDFLGTNGQLDAFVVVGADSQPSDVVGAGDIIAGLSQLSYNQVATSSGGTVVSSVGGTTEEVGIESSFGAAINFGNLLNDKDLPSLADSKITVYNDEGDNEEYDYHEEIYLQTAAQGDIIQLRTALTSTQRNQDYMDDIVLDVPSDSIKYLFVLDDDQDQDSLISGISSATDPLEINFLGRDLRIINADASSITVEVGERVELEGGNTYQTEDGKIIEFVRAASATESRIEVDGVANTIRAGASKTINGVEIKVVSVSNDEGTDADITEIVIGTSATNYQAEETYNNGDDFIIPCGTAWKSDGCDVSDADWEWEISGLDQIAKESVVLGVTFDQGLTDIDDNPPRVGSDNNVFDLPAGFARISLDGIVSSDSVKYTIEPSRESVYTSLDSSASDIKYRGILFEGNGEEDSFTTTNVGETDKMFFYLKPATSTTTTLHVANYDEGEGRFLEVSGAIGTDTSLGTITNDDASTTLHATSDVTTQDAATLTIELGGSASPDLSFFATEDASIQTQDSTERGFNWIGSEDGDGLSSGDIVYDTNGIGSYEENLLTASGIRVYNPDSNSGSDKIEFDFPNEYGSNYEVYVTIGTSDTTVSSTSTSGNSINQVVPITQSVTRLDSEVGSIERSSNLVLVGGPAINRLTAEAMGLQYPATGAASGISEGTGVIRIIDNAFTQGKVAVIVAGYESAETRLATSVLQQAATRLAGISGQSATVSGSSVTSAVITPSQ